MTLDPTLGAAVVTAAGGLLQKLLELAIHPSPDAQTETVLSKVYEDLADAVSPNSLRVLIVLKDAGAFQLPDQLVGPAQELANRQEPNGKPFEPDITYRLWFLALLGLVRRGTSDFALTNFGDAFIEYARKDQFRYKKAFAMIGG